MAAVPLVERAGRETARRTRPQRRGRPTRTLLLAVAFLATGAANAGCGGSAPTRPCTCADLCDVMDDYAGQIGSANPFGSGAECKRGCASAAPARQEAAFDRAASLSDATPEELGEALRRMQLDPPFEPGP